MAGGGARVRNRASDVHLLAKRRGVCNTIMPPRCHIQSPMMWPQSPAGQTQEVQNIKPYSLHYTHNSYFYRVIRYRYHLVAGA